MTRHLRGILIAGFGLLVLSAAPILAHHSFAAEYDADKPVTLKGVLTKVEWLNPHIFFYIDVKDQKGKVVHWAISGPSPTGISHSGGKKSTLTDRVGETITVQGYLAKSGAPLANMRSVRSADGKLLLDRIGDQQ
jgi:hypothetical protein